MIHISQGRSTQDNVECFRRFSDTLSGHGKVDDAIVGSKKWTLLTNKQISREISDNE
jgi:hypothetical protein